MNTTLQLKFQLTDPIPTSIIPIEPLHIATLVSIPRLPMIASRVLN